MSTLRITGLASGMDIDSMVSNLMKAERMPLDKLKQKQQVLAWQVDDYRSMNTLLLNFRSELTNMKMTSNYRARTTTSSNEALVTATASSAASQASYSITNVSQLASAATLTNGVGISVTGQKVDLNKSIYENRTAYNDQSLTWSEGSVETKTFSAPSTGTNFSLGLSGTSLKDITSMNVKVNNISYEVVADPVVPGANQVSVKTDGSLQFGTQIAAGSNISVDYFANKKVETLASPTTDTDTFKLSKGSIKTLNYFKVGTDTYTIDPASAGTTKNLKLNGGSVAGTIDTITGTIKLDNKATAGSAVSADYTQNYTTFSISSATSNGTVKQNFSVQGSDTLNQVISKVNNSTAGVTMLYDTYSDQMMLTRKETGDFNTSGKEITTSGDFINKTLAFGSGSETGGANAIFTLNGLDTQRSSNTFDISGVTFTLKQTFNTGSADISIHNDTDTVFNNIKKFVDDYNTLIGTINGKISEDHYRDYPPLTDDQKTQLSQPQQDQWTAKAKSGLLRNDSTLKSVLDQMRSNFYTPVQNSLVAPAYKQLANVGITTTSNYLEGGKLQIDDAKLKAAIEADPDSVENLFRGTGSTSSEQGILQRLFTTVSNTMDSITRKAGNSYSTSQQFDIGKQLDSLTSQISSFEDRMNQVEDRYYSQFTAMEQAIMKSNSQMSYLQQQFGGGR